ncbi:unnamed protein product [Closterium sp. NIES-53]
MALVPKHLRHNKLGAKAIWAVHLGMAQKSKGWLLWDPFTKKLLLSSGSTTTRQYSLVNGGEEAKDAEEEEEEVQQVSERAPTLPSRTTSAPRIRVTSQQRQGLHVPVAEEEGRGKRRIQAPNRLTYEALGKPAKSALAGAALMVGEDEESDYEECAFAFFSPVEMPGEPATLKEALESSDAEEWKKAMESELKSIEENGTWELVELPEGRKAIMSKWLYKIKSDADGKIERYKSRLVAKGYQQKEKVDYKELFAPVVKPTTLRTLLAGAAIKGWVVKQMDVTTAFLNGVLEEEIFMAQPEGFDVGSGRVLRLKKALYGLKQAPRQWYLKLRGVLEEIGFTPSTADHLLFMLGEGEKRSFMVVYVDDILIFSPSSDLVKEVMLKLQDKFKCKALGDVSFYLGLHIERDVEKRCMRVHQRKYLEALAATFGQSEGHVATPFPSGFKCVKGPEEESVGEEERRRFHSLVGSLMYAAVNTRPDVAFATGQLARVVQCPNEEQVAAGMRVAKYLGQTATVGLQFSAAAQRRQKGADAVTTAVALLFFTSQCFFRDHTTVTPLSAPIPVTLADPTSGPAVARSITTLPCLAVPFGFLTGLYIPSFSRNMVGVGYLQERGITITLPAHGRKTICTDASTGALLATFSRETHSGLLVLHTACPQVAAYGPDTASSQVALLGQVTVSGQVAASCSCRSLTHSRVLWHHRLGHSSLLRLRRMASQRLVSGLPRVFASLPPSPALLCMPCVEGRLRTTPHSSLRPASAPFLTLHLDVWGPAPRLGLEREGYFLVVIDDYFRHTTVFPLAKKSEVTSTRIRWLLAIEAIRVSHVLCLHSDRVRAFFSGVLAVFCGEQGMTQS